MILLLSECKKHDIHTCIDTTGYVSGEVLRKAILLTDLFLFDIKLMDNDEHERFCGVPNSMILENFKTIYESESDLRLRFPVIPGITDTNTNLKTLADFASGFPGVPIDLLPYHSIGRDKYRRLGMDYYMDDIEKPSDERMTELAKFFESFNIKTKIGG